MPHKPLLSICIPTYNKEKYLGATLDSIITQEWFDEEEIEIIVSDNASQDNTAKLMEGYQNRYKNIKYVRNNENIGAAKNILNLVLHLSKWEYVWLFWSDDLMSPVWIKKTIHAIKDHTIDMVLSYRIDFTDGNEPVNFINNESSPQILHGVTEFSDFLSTDRDDNFRRYAELLTFISIMCFRRKAFQDSFDEMMHKYSKKYREYICNKHYFWHAIILYGFLKQESIIWIYKDTLTYCRMWGQDWNMSFRIIKDISDVFIKFYINHKRINNKVIITFSRIILSWIFPMFAWIIKTHTSKKTFEYMKKTYLKLTNKQHKG